MIKILLPISDYIKTRKRLWLKLFPPILFAGIFIGLSYLIPVQENLDIQGIFSEFVSAQVSIIAIFISFSIAIISILVSADNKNIQRLRETESSDGTIKELNGKPLTLFQVLLSNLTYNVFVEILYLAILIVYLLLRAVVHVCVLRYLIAFSIFCIVHILQILLETVIQMYLTFWRS